MEYPFYDAAGIGRQVDENAVLEKIRAGNLNLTEDERDFVRLCLFYYRTETQGEIAGIARKHRLFPDEDITYFQKK